MVSAFTCEIDGCAKTSRSPRGGLCEMHYYRVRRRGTAGGATTQRERHDTCQYVECTAPHHSKGLCARHYMNQLRTGCADGTGHASGDRSAQWVGDAVSYMGMHFRIYRAHGPASSQVCECGQQAHHWSYDHSDESEQWEVVGGYNIPYSTDISHYQPKCRTCHRRFDVQISRSKEQ